MTSILSLSIHSWVPIGIVKQHYICSSQIQTNTTWSGRWNKAENPRISVESFDNFLTILNLRRPIQSDIREVKQIQDILEDIQHSWHLCKNQDFIATRFEFLQQLNHCVEFTAIVHKKLLRREAENSADITVVELSC